MNRPAFRDARREEIDRVLEQTHAVWSGGLESGEYRSYVHTLLDSDWARSGNYRFLVLVDDDAGGNILASMKLYRFLVRVGSGEGSTGFTAGGIGGVFTDPESRRQGFARQMLERSHELMAERGDGMSLLFSEIGASYYMRLRYRELDPHPAFLNVPETGPQPEGLSRMHKSEIERVMRIHKKGDGRFSLAIERSREYWAYLLARYSYPTLHLGRDRWESRIMLNGDRGYLWSLFGVNQKGQRARLLEFSEVEPGAALPALLDDLFDECRRRGVSSVDAWLPHDAISRDRRLGKIISKMTPSPAVSQVAPMWLPLRPTSEASVAAHAGGVVLHLADAF